MTSDAQTEFSTAVEIARQALETWRENPDSANFRIWRDASEVAIKWHRAARMSGEADRDWDSDLEDLLRTK